jgi:signal transduction histidine kinase
VTLVQNTPLLQMIMDALPTPVVILNQNRQIVAVNRVLLQMLNVGDDEVIGRRTGEVMGCTFSGGGPDGCGTTKYCLTCGAVAAVLESQQSRSQATRECRLTLDTALDGGARDLRVTATALEVSDELFTVCTIEDISQQKRLSVLSRVFFHDVLNTAGGMQGYVRLLEEDLREDSKELVDIRMLGDLAGQLVDEIESQRDLVLAESGDLEVDAAPVRPVELLEDLRALYSSHPVASGREIRMVDVWDGDLSTDSRLLSRVLGNMLKNALEATEIGGTVVIRCVRQDEHVVFSVHNPSVMPQEVQFQIFQRSFSTKAGTGRGIGTYSVKLLGEHYLGGKVEFSSEESEGTTFTITLPIRP